MKTKHLSSDKSFVLVFETGDKVIENLIEFARDNSVAGAFFFGLGAFERATLAFFDLAKKEYEHIPIDEQVEVMSITGNISMYRGEPKIHAHAVIGKRDGAAHGGHLIEGIVRPTLEVFVTTAGDGMRRTLDMVTDLPLLDLNG
jgi:predicted DNA-binding protein with PD1-like motif